MKRTRTRTGSGRSPTGVRRKYGQKVLRRRKDIGNNALISVPGDESGNRPDAVAVVVLRGHRSSSAAGDLDDAQVLLVRRSTGAFAVRGPS